jgi:hypothetical protein
MPSVLIRDSYPCVQDLFRIQPVYVGQKEDDVSHSGTNGLHKDSHPSYGPFIAKVKSVSGIRGDESFQIIGVNFGDFQTTGEVYIGSKKQYNPKTCFGKDCYGGVPTGGTLQARVKKWADIKVKVKAKFNETKWGGEKKYV